MTLLASYLSSYPNLDEDTESSRSFECPAVSMLMVDLEITDLERTDPLTEDLIDSALSNRSLVRRLDLIHQHTQRVRMTMTAKPNTPAAMPITAA